MDLLSVLAVIFIVLKLAGLIDWSWLVVLIPLYTPFILAAVMIFLSLGRR